MKEKEEMIMSGIEPAIREKLISRREALISVGKLGLGALSAPLAVGILSNAARRMRQARHSMNR